jgi:hypothetical protein
MVFQFDRLVFSTRAHCSRALQYLRLRRFGSFQRKSLLELFGPPIYFRFVSSDLAYPRSVERRGGGGLSSGDCRV